MPATDTRLSSPVVDALRQCRSVRAFTDRPVDSALLAEVFAAAQRAPSGGNLQPWQATILTGEPWQAMQDAVAARIAMGREGRQMEYDIYPPALTEPWDSRRFGVGEALYASLGIPREDKRGRSEEHTSELQSLMRTSYAVLCLKKKKHNYTTLSHS